MSENKYPIGGYAPGDKPLHCTLTDTELAAKADQWIDELIASGGKSFTMQVPARPNADTDLIFAELNNRFKRLISEKPVGPVWVKASIRPPTGHSSDYHWRFAHNKKPINRNFHIESGILIQEYGNTKGSYSLEELEWLDESGTASNKDAIENEQEQKKAKAWDDWKDSLVTHDNVFVHYKTKDEHYTGDFTLEEFKKVMIEKSPVFIFCNEWSSKTPHFQITTRVMPVTGFYYFCNAWADKTPVHTTIEEFYKKLQQPGLKYFSF